MKCRDEVRELVVWAAGAELDADEHRQVADALQAMLRKHLATIGAQMPLPNPSYDPNLKWTAEKALGKPDPYESEQESDPRRYVTDPTLDYGAEWTVSDRDIID